MRQVADSWEVVKAHLPKVESPAFYARLDACLLCHKRRYCVLVVWNGGKTYDAGLMPLCGHCVGVVGKMVLKQPLPAPGAEGVWEQEYELTDG